MELEYAWGRSQRYCGFLRTGDFFKGLPSLGARWGGGKRCLMPIFLAFEISQLNGCFH